MRKGNLSRRGFLQSTLAGLGAAGLPLWFGREVVAAEELLLAQAQKTAAANDKIVMAFIGVGSPQSRGLQVYNNTKKFKNVQVAAVCDVDKSHRERAAKVIAGEPVPYADFRELLDKQKDVNAVVIATPDQWHAQVALECIKRGKDVYCEKPLTLTIDEGKVLVKAAKAKNTVFQTGSQQRSEYGGRFRLAAELARNGRLGKIESIETRIGTNPKGGPFKVETAPDGLDWDFWLGPTPKVDYVKEKGHYTFRWFYDYSGGKMTDWGAHHNDIAQWALNADNAGPIAIEGVGEAPSKDPNSYNCHPTFKVTYTYSGDVKVICTADGENGVKINGEGGKWIFVSRGKIEASDPKLLSEPLPKDAVRLYEANDHMGNFLDCIASRKATTCDVGIGHRSCSMCHLGVIALQTGAKLKWDPVKEAFVDNEEANKKLSRPRREPWKLEV